MSISRTLARSATAAAALVVLSACSTASSPAPTPAASDSPVPQISAGDVATPSPSVEAPIAVGGARTASVAERTTIATNLRTPWDIAWAPDGSALVTERDRGGILRITMDGDKNYLDGPGADFLRSKIDNASEGGLLGIALHPDDPTLVYVYLTTTKNNTLVRMRLNGDTLTDPEFVLSGIPDARWHNGGRIAFGPDGYLYVATGDATETSLSQKRNSLGGKILRVIADGTDNDGKKAPGNPFDTRVWSWGHRNVQGLGWTADGRMYASELGQNSPDELNRIEPGNNYGWPEYEAMNGAPSGTDLGDTRGGFTFPVAQWGTDDASPSGIAVTNEAIYVGALRGERVWRVPLTATGVGEPHVLLDDLGRIRMVSVGPDGALYILTTNTDANGDADSSDDKLVRIVIEENL